MDTVNAKATQEFLPPVDSKINLQVSTDKLIATINITAPENGGKPVSEQDILSFLKQRVILNDIDESMVKMLGTNPTFDQWFAVSKGRESVPGENASLKFLINLDTELRPTILPDGSVDYKDLGIIQSVEEDQVLCEKIPATKGTEGVNVHGQKIAAKSGKDILMPLGKGTKFSEDKLKILAACTGHVNYLNKKINVTNTYVVEESVGVSTGNIKFEGNVTVMGSVLSGFSIKATGNVDINGVVEGSNIEAGGDVIVRGGFNGSDRGEIIAQGNIKCKYIQSGKVNARGNIETGYIFNSFVKSGGTVSVIGPKGLIVGGHIVAREAIDCSYYGGKNSAVPTTVEVGNDPVVISRYHDLPGEIEACKKSIESSQRLVALFSELKAANRLAGDNVGKLSQAIATVEQGEHHIQVLEEELEEVKQKVSETGFGTVFIRKNMYFGTKVIIGAEVKNIKEDFTFCKFVRVKEGIVSRTIG